MYLSISPNFQIAFSTLNRFYLYSFVLFQYATTRVLKERLN